MNDWEMRQFAAAMDDLRRGLNESAAHANDRNADLVERYARAYGALRGFVEAAVDSLKLIEPSREEVREG